MTRCSQYRRDINYELDWRENGVCGGGCGRWPLQVVKIYVKRKADRMTCRALARLRSPFRAGARGHFPGGGVTLANRGGMSEAVLVNM